MLEALIEDLKRDEGWRASAYQDHLGYWTIGYGFLIDRRRDGELPESVAEVWLQEAVASRWSQLIAKHAWIEAQPDDVRRALGNMCYQLGVAGVCRFKMMLACLEAGDRAGAATEALNSSWAAQTPGRAIRVATLIRGF